MNEFIVWDKEEKKFFDDWVFFDNDSGDLYQNGTPIAIENSNFKAFWYIGKTDTEGNKIYADSSIVNTDVNSSGFKMELNGYFKYDNVNLAYNFHRVPFDNKSPNNIISFKDNNFSRIKIIDTLQENKLGLFND